MIIVIYIIASFGEHIIKTVSDVVLYENDTADNPLEINTAKIPLTEGVNNITVD